jgi:MmyB-like transcription regulator ligand binding domain
MARLDHVVGRGSATEAGEGLIELVTALSPHPACVLDARWDMVAWNDAADFPLGGIDAGDKWSSNLIGRMFATSTCRIWSSRRREASQLRRPARSLGSTQRRLDDQAMEGRNSRNIRPPSQMIEGHDRCRDESAAQSGLFNQNGQTEVEMAIVLAKNDLMPTPIVDPKEIDPVGRNVIAQLRRCLETKPRNQNVPHSNQPANPPRLTPKHMDGEALGVARRIARQIDREGVSEARFGVERPKHRTLRQIDSSNTGHKRSARTEWKRRGGGDQ